MASDPITPFDHLRHMLRTHSIPLRIAVVRMILAEVIACNLANDRERLTRHLVRLLDDIAEDHR